ncbi:transposase [Salinibacter ruber]|nr:transposase [Salinibacter ruber]
MNSLMSNTNASNLFFQRSKAAVVRTTTTERSRAASSGFCAPGPPGETCLNGRGNWKTAYDRFRRWAEDGTLESIVRHLQGELEAEGRIDWSQFNVDSTIVQAARAAAGGPNDSKKGTEPGEMQA